MLGKVSTVASVSGASYINSPCLQAQITGGQTVDTYDAVNWATDMTILNAVNPKVVFCSSVWDCPGTSVDVMFPDTSGSLLAVGEAVGFMSLFFNEESKAKSVYSTMSSRYSCTKNNALAATSGSLSKKVVWSYYYGGSWYVGNCPNYYCDAIKAAGGVMLPAISSSGYTNDQMKALGAAADIWIFASDNWDSFMKAEYLNSSSPIGAVIRASPAATNQKIYDFMRKSSSNSWFQDRPSAPDALVQDLAKVINPDFSHDMIWFRNVFTETSLSSPSATCTSGAANLKSSACSMTENWDSGCAAAMAKVGGPLGALSISLMLALAVIFWQRWRLMRVNTQAANASQLNAGRKGGVAGELI